MTAPKPEMKLPENIERLLQRVKMYAVGSDVADLRRAIAAALLRSKADGIDAYTNADFPTMVVTELRAQADALEGKR